MEENYWQRLQKLFHQSEKLAPEEVDDFLDKHCGENIELKNELQSILKINTQGSAQLTKQVIGAARELTKDPVVKGIRIGVYEIISEIGKGGMGTVYLAQRADNSYQQKVAIKLISNHQNTDEITKRFVTERQILAQLTHPNIARLLDGGTTESGKPYFAMEYIKGQGIVKYCDSQQLAIKQRLELFLLVCSAISHAHGKLILHRDIKPSNILVAENGEPKLLDFGIAKLLKSEGIDASVTGFDCMIMTPEYASPEQVLGKPMGVASDIYQLGLVLYQLLTGEKAQKIIHNYYVEVKQAIVDNKPLSPSAQISTTKNTNRLDSQSIAKDRDTVPEKLLSNLKGDLDTIVLKCLHKDPEQRYQSVKDLSDDITAYLQLRPIKARGLSQSYRFKRFVRRHWIGVMATTVTASALVLGLTFTLISLKQTKQAEHKAEIEAQTANQVSQFLVDMISQADPRESGGKDVTVLQVLKKSLKEIDKLDTEPKIKAKLLTVIGKTYVSLGELSVGLELLNKSIDFAEKHRFRDANLLIQALIERSVVHNNQGNLSMAIIDAKSALSLARKKSVVSTKILSELAGYLFVDGKFKEASKLLYEAIDILDKDSNRKTREKVDVLNRLGLINVELRNYEQAEHLLKQANQLIELIPSEFNSIQINSFYLGLLYSELYKYEKAERHLIKSVELTRKIFGNNHQNLAIILTSLGQLQIRKFKLDSAEKTLVEARNIFQSKSETENYYYIMLLQNWSALKYHQGEYLEASSTITNAISIADKLFGKEHLQRNTTYTYILRPLYTLMQYQKVSGIAQEIILNLSQYYSPDHGFILYSKSFLGLATVQLGHFEKAKVIANELLASSEDTYVLAGLRIIFHMNLLIGDYNENESILKRFQSIITNFNESKNKDFRLNYIKLLIQHQLNLETSKLLADNINRYQKLILERYNSNHPEYLLSESYKSLMFSNKKEHSKAIDLISGVYGKWLEHFNINELNSSFLALDYSEILLNASKTPKAIKLLKQYIPTLKKSFDDTHYQLNRARCLLGKAFIQQGEKVKGRALVNQALTHLKSTLGAKSPLVKSCQSE